MLAWGGFVLCIYFLTMCVLVVLRGQWVERERLLFPLAVLPLEMTDTGDGRVGSPLFRNPLMWVGALVPTAVGPTTIVPPRTAFAESPSIVPDRPP